MIIASFDIGINNFSYSIDECNISIEKKIKLKYKKNGLPDSDTQKLIDIFLTNIKNIFFHNLSLLKTLDKDELRSFVLHIYQIIQDPIFKQCDKFLIEQQMKTNYIALKIEQTLFTLLTILFPLKEIIRYSSRNKTNIIGMEKTLKDEKYITLKSERKKWSYEKVKEIFLMNNYFDKYNKLESLSKKDDVCDCILMNISYFIKIYN